MAVNTSGDPGTSANCAVITPESGSPLDVSAEGYLSFFVKDMRGADTVKVTMTDTSGAVWSGWTTASSVQNQWTKISLPLVSVCGLNGFITSIKLGEWNPGTYYFDDLYFSPNSSDSIPAFLSSYPPITQPPAPPSTSIWYNSFEGGTGYSAGSGATVSLNNSSANSGGAECVKMALSSSNDPGTSGNCVVITPESGSSLDVSAEGYLSFFVKDTVGANTVKVTITDKSNAVWSGWTTAQSVQNQWTKISVPLSSVSGINESAISSIKLGEWNSGTYYFDDVYFSVNASDGIPAFLSSYPPITQPPTTATWYQNFEAGTGFSAGTNATVSSDNSSANSGGAKSVKLAVSANGDPGTSGSCVVITPQSSSSFDASAEGYLIFFVKDTQGANTVKVTITDASGATWSGWTSAQSVQNQWTKISVPLSSVSGINKSAISSIKLGEWNSGTYYFDDVYFSANSSDSIPAFS